MNDFGWCIRCLTWVDRDPRRGVCCVCGATTLEESPRDPDLPLSIQIPDPDQEMQRFDEYLGESDDHAPHEEGPAAS